MTSTSLLTKLQRRWIASFWAGILLKDLFHTGQVWRLIRIIRKLQQEKNTRIRQKLFLPGTWRSLNGKTRRWQKAVLLKRSPSLRTRKAVILLPTEAVSLSRHYLKII